MSHSATKNSSRKKKVFVEKADELCKRMSMYGKGGTRDTKGQKEKGREKQSILIREIKRDFICTTF